MNKKGFTLVELLAVLVVLGIVVGITIPSVNGIIKSSKAKSEEAFVETIKDAMDIYLSSDAKQLKYKDCLKNTSYSYAVVVENSIERGVRFQDVIDSPYQPINAASLVNPANEKKCGANASIEIFKNANYVYYYRINKSAFNCLDNIDSSNSKNKINYISNLKEPGEFKC